jgi:hypothetical protein
VLAAEPSHPGAQPPLPSIVRSHASRHQGTGSLVAFTARLTGPLSPLASQVTGGPSRHDPQAHVVRHLSPRAGYWAAEGQQPAIRHRVAGRMSRGEGHS